MAGDLRAGWGRRPLGKPEAPAREMELQEACPVRDTVREGPRPTAHPLGKHGTGYAPVQTPPTAQTLGVRCSFSPVDWVSRK